MSAVVRCRHIRGQNLDLVQLLLFFSAWSVREWAVLVVGTQEVVVEVYTMLLSLFGGASCVLQPCGTVETVQVRVRRQTGIPTGNFLGQQKRLRILVVRVIILSF